MKSTTHRRTGNVLLVVLALSLSPLTAFAEEPYSPYVDQTYPTKVYWGDTHVHTFLSGDAFAMGARLTPDDAYRFAKGETIKATGGEEVRLRRPLDFVMVADHAENLGVLPRLAAGDGTVPATEHSEYWAKLIATLTPLPDVLNAENAEAFNRGNQLLMSAKGAWQGNYGIDEGFKRSVWEGVIASAQRHNDPGKFTAFIGYEWSARDAQRMVHRNVLFAGGPEEALQVLPYSRFDSDDPEDLWAYLQDYEDRTGGRVMAIPHNANLSGGNMFKLGTFDGKPLTETYARTRSRWEPLLEATQIKGDSETHPFLSPADEFSDYETWPPLSGFTSSKGGDKSAKDGDKSAKDGDKSAKDGDKSAKDVTKGAKDGQGVAFKRTEETSYARSALKLGLEQEAKLGVNPFKFGMIGSTDSHTALATADEDTFWGKMGLNEPSPYRSAIQWYYSASGYAGVWATENTRESLFAAMRRKETYATTGPRMTVRFFGGWGYAAEDAARSDLAQAGYAGGVPMGGDLAHGPEGKSPSFLVRAVKDPDGANLDRVQVIKGWRDGQGKLHEKIYDVALSDGRVQDGAGKVEPVGNTVDVKDASYANSIGDPELAVVWKDPDFNGAESAFYYVRVLEIPTPRWTAYDAKHYGLKDLPENIPMITQERAYTSPIWYTP